MPIVFNCPECQKQLRIQDGMGGKKVRCPHCKAIAVAPAEEEPIVATPVDDDEAVTAGVPLPPLGDTFGARRRHRDEDDDDSLQSRQHLPRRRDVLDDIAADHTMPSSVVLAVVAMCLMIGLYLTAGVLVPFVTNPADEMGQILEKLLGAAFIPGLITWGLIAGHRLAWQWGRILGLFGGFLAGLLGIMFLAKQQGAMPTVIWLMSGIGSLMFSLCLFTISFSLATRSAKTYFRLRCPSCGRFTSSAADFMFHKAKCKRCKEVW